MASLNREPTGTWRIQFDGPDGRRRTLRLGKLSRRGAEQIKVHVERLLECKRIGVPADPATAQWLEVIDESLRERLARAGLLDGSRAAQQTVAAYLTDWLAARDRFKPASKRAWKQVIDGMVRLFGDRLVGSLVRADAEQFRQTMLDAGLRDTTIHKRLNHARQMFRDAEDMGLVGSNPFNKVRHRAGNPAERRAYVPVTAVLRILDYCPNTTWKLLIALARFQGLRTPSETFSLRWSDVDWERNRLTVPVPKLEHVPGREHRIMPLFPEARPWLERAFEEAPEGAVYIIPEDYRRRAQGPDGWANANLRTTFKKIIRRAGVEPWPRLWHSLRASCETDLTRQFPLPVVTRWLGNSPTVALRHYVDVTDADYERGAIHGLTGTHPRAVQPDVKSDVKVTQKATLQASAGNCTNWKDSSETLGDGDDMPRLADSCNVVHKCSRECMGIEPTGSFVQTPHWF